MRNKLCASIVGLALSCTSLLAGTASAATTSSTPFVRGVYGRDASASGVDTIKSTGFNTVTVQPWRDHLDDLAARGMGGVVWLFGYNNATCSFDRDDEWVRQTVSAIAGHEAIVAYNVADEPNYRECPDAPAEIAARSRLVKSVDPSKPTYVVVAAWDGREGFPYQHFAGTTDIMGLDVYPCGHGAPCKYADIDSAIAEAAKDGVDRYWAILQDFGDAWYRVPTSVELQRQFDHWAGSGMEGYFVYHWNVGEVENRPDHLAVLKAQNAKAFGAGAATPAPSATPAPVEAPAVTPATPETVETPAVDEPAPAAAPAPAPRPAPHARPAGRGKRPDHAAPSAPRALKSIPLANGSQVSWKPAQDDRGVAGYAVWRDGRKLGKTETTSFLDGETVTGRHVYSVRAFDAAGNRSRPAVLKVRSWRRPMSLSTPWCFVAGAVFRVC